MPLQRRPLSGVALQLFCKVYVYIREVILVVWVCVLILLFGGCFGGGVGWGCGVAWGVACE